MLENAVAPIKELRQVKVHGDLHKTKTGEALSYDEYTSLLLSAATAYDSQHRNKPTTKQRSVYAHKMYDDDDASVLESYDIDYPVQSIRANVHDQKYKSNIKKQNQFQQRTCMSRDKWFALSEEGRQIWDKLEDKEKAIILGISPPSNYTKSSTRSVNLHETSVYDFLVQAHLHEIDVEDDGGHMESADTPLENDGNCPMLRGATGFRLESPSLLSLSLYV
jgi:hypothetical protein